MAMGSWRSSLATDRLPTAESGLMVGLKKGRDPVAEEKEGKLQRFAVAGTNRVWQWASAVIDGKTVLVRMCDYASAGRTWSGESALRVWLPQPLNLEKPFSP